jgi:hypothetical protein
MNHVSDDIQRLVERAPVSPSEWAEQERLQRRQAAVVAFRDIVPEGLLAGRDIQATVDALPESLARVVAWNWGDGPRLIVGASGRGKSTACALLIRRLLRDWVVLGTPEARRAERASWWRSRALAREVQFSPLGKPCPSMESAIRAPLLILDDLGWEPDPAFIGDLLCERDDNGRPTIATSGQPLEALEARYGAPLVRRLIERGQLVEAW